MATWSEWFKAAGEKNFPLEKYLVINQAEDIARLHNSGLPFYDFILIDGKDYQKEKEKIRNFSGKHEEIWVRINNKSKKGERFYKLDLKTYKEIISFIEGLKINISDFNIQIFEYHNNKFGGNIVSEAGKISIEIIEGKQELVSRSTEPFFHGNVDSFGNITFFEKNVPESIVSAAKKVLNYLKKSRNSYLEGYFEFVVSDKGKVYFLDYKTSFR